MTENRKRVPDFFGRLYPDDLQRGSFLGTWVRRAEVDELLDEIQQLRSTLSLAEEGLANYAQEVERLRQEIEVLRLYGNKDCTWMADEELERRRAEPQSGEQA